MIALSAPRNRASGQVRIISGKWRGRKLPVLLAEGLRPTTDRTKETLFNWLMNDVRDARCLDAFAGAGSLGFEALSRGASEQVFFEKDPKVAKTLTDNVQRLDAQAQVLCGDSLQLLKKQSSPFDIIFVDPPYNQNLVTPFITQLLHLGLAASDALIYIEHEASLAVSLPNTLELHREKSTNQFRYALYKVAH